MIDDNPLIEFTILDGEMTLHRFSEEEVEYMSYLATMAINYVVCTDSISVLQEENPTFIVMREGYDGLCEKFMEIRYEEELRKRLPPGEEEILWD